MKNICFVVTVTLLTLAGIRTQALATGGEGGIGGEVTSIDIDGGESGYKFRLKADSNGNLESVTAIWNDKLFKFGPDTFGVIKSPYLRGVLISGMTEISGGPQRQVILKIPYDTFHFFANDDKKTERQTSNMIRMYFKEGKLIEWSKAEGSPNLPEKWKIIDWSDGKTTEQKELVSKTYNPYETFRFSDDTP